MTGIFGVVALVLATGVDYMISTGLRKSDSRKYVVWNEIYQGGIDADGLIIGSSRAWMTYNTYIIDSMLECNSYNLGLNGHTLPYQIIRYDTYRRYNAKPKMVLLNVDLYSTLGEMSDPPYEREQFFPYMWTDDSLMNVVKKEKELTLLDRYMPLYRYIGYRSEFEQGMKLFWGVPVDFDNDVHKGFRGEHVSWHVEEDDRDRELKYETDENALQLDSFVCSLVNDGIEVYLVKAPFHHWMFDHFTNIEYSDSVFAVIADKYDVPLIDMYRTEYSNDTSLYCNPSHMNYKGADIFSRDLCDRIKTQFKQVE